VTNGAPTAVADSYSVLSSGTTVISATGGVLGNDSDPEGDTLTASLVSGPAQGSLTLNSDGSFSYTPGGGFAGTDSFSYLAADGVT
jgi:hypothetical protein